LLLFSSFSLFLTGYGRILVLESLDVKRLSRADSS